MEKQQYMMCIIDVLLFFMHDLTNCDRIKLFFNTNFTDACKVANREFHICRS